MLLQQSKHPFPKRYGIQAQPSRYCWSAFPGSLLLSLVRILTGLVTHIYSFADESFVDMLRLIRLSVQEVEEHEGAS